MADREGYGFLFPVADDKKTENGPAMSGNFVFMGQIIEIAGWSRTKDGKKWLSLKVGLPVKTDGSDDAPADDAAF